MANNQLKLHLYHGRKDPIMDMEDWGFDFEPIRGVTGVTVTYQCHYRVTFVDAEACSIAQKQTGWSEWDVNVLLMRIHEDMVEVRQINDTPSYFGDWHLGIPTEQ